MPIINDKKCIACKDSFSLMPNYWQWNSRALEILFLNKCYLFFIKRQFPLKLSPENEIFQALYSLTLNNFISKKCSTNWQKAFFLKSSNFYFRKNLISLNIFACVTVSETK